MGNKTSIARVKEVYWRRVNYITEISKLTERHGKSHSNGWFRFANIFISWQRTVLTVFQFELYFSMKFSYDVIWRRGANCSDIKKVACVTHLICSNSSVLSHNHMHHHMV